MGCIRRVIGWGRELKRLLSVESGEYGAFGEREVEFSALLNTDQAVIR